MSQSPQHGAAVVFVFNPSPRMVFLGVLGVLAVQKPSPWVRHPLRVRRNGVGYALSKPSVDLAISSLGGDETTVFSKHSRLSSPSGKAARGRIRDVFYRACRIPFLPNWSVDLLNLTGNVPIFAFALRQGNTVYVYQWGREFYG